MTTTILERAPDAPSVDFKLPSTKYLPFEIEGRGVHAFLVQKDEDDSELFSVITSVISNHMSHSTMMRMRGQYSLLTLLQLREPLSNYLAALVKRDGEMKGAVEAIGDLLSSAEAKQLELLKYNADRGVIEAEDIPFVFKPGDPVAVMVHGQLIGGTLASIKREVTWMGAIEYHASLSVIHNARGTVSEGKVNYVQPYFDGLAPVDEIGIQRVSEEMRATLAARGQIFERATKGSAAHMQYSGQLRRSGWFSDKNYSARGRVMLDPGSFGHIDNDQQDLEIRKLRLEVPDNDTFSSALEVTDENRWRCFPFVFGFSFKAKQWGRMNVNELTEINWRSDAYDQLVLPEKEKKLVRALVENYQGTFEDIIEDKGGGVIFLMHGPPGQGKTLTAEAIAEVLKRPLYSISVGELGVNPHQLEETLRTVLDIATIWDAVVLLDEADIFLEERDEKDIVRNAMVGVFLRLLEYHQGVMFMTSNRVKNIDVAFYSRISVALHYPDATVEKREKVWTNLLRAAKLDDKIDAAKMAQHDINGRQIKTTIRLSQSLARSENIEVNEDLMASVMELSTKFAEQMKAQHDG